MSWLDFVVQEGQQFMMNSFDLNPIQARMAFWTVTVGITCNVSCALLGCYLLLRRLSLLGDAISHGVLPGIALAFFFSGEISGWYIILGAMLFGILTAYLTELVSSYGKVAEDASLGVVYTSLFAIGVVMISAFASKTHLDADCVLYGQIETTPFSNFTLLGYRIPLAMKTLGIMLLASLVFIALFWKELKLVSFDPALATAMGFSAGLLHYLLMGMVAAVTVASFEIVGSILVIAMLIVPAATAHLLTDRLSRMMWCSALIGALSALFGYIGALYWESNVAGMMAVAVGLQFLLAVLFAPRHGILSKVIRNARLSFRILREDILALLYRTEEAHQRGDREIRTVPISDIRLVAQGMGGKLALAMLRWKKFLEIDQTNQQVQLTDKGRRSAGSVVRSHRLWESFLEEKMQLPLDHLHEPAHEMEHFIGPGLQSELESQLSQSETDPHGRVIPPPRGENGGDEQ